MPVPELSEFPPSTQVTLAVLFYKHITKPKLTPQQHNQSRINSNRKNLTKIEENNKRKKYLQGEWMQQHTSDLIYQSCNQSMHISTINLTKRGLS